MAGEDVGGERRERRELARWRAGEAMAIPRPVVAALAGKFRGAAILESVQSDVSALTKQSKACCLLGGGATSGKREGGIRIRIRHYR